MLIGNRPSVVRYHPDSVSDYTLNVVICPHFWFGNLNSSLILPDSSIPSITGSLLRLFALLDEIHRQANDTMPIWNKWYELQHKHLSLTLHCLTAQTNVQGYFWPHIDSRCHNQSVTTFFGQDHCLWLGRTQGIRSTIWDSSGSATYLHIAYQLPTRRVEFVLSPIIHVPLVAMMWMGLTTTHLAEASYFRSASVIPSSNQDYCRYAIAVNLVVNETCLSNWDMYHDNPAKD